MSCKTFSRFSGLVFLVAALVGGISNALAASGSTPQGLRADGLRLQAQAERYAQLRGFTQDGLKADGLRYQAMAHAYAAKPAASYYSPRALKADGLRWQRMAQAYASPQVIRGNGFDWGAALIGALGSFVAVLCGVVLIVGVRRMRHEKLAV